MAPSLRLVDLRIPLRRPFANAAGGAVAERRVVLVGVSEDGTTGWGEAAPYPGITAEDADDVWEALRERAAQVLGGDLYGLPPAAAAAVDQARADLSARLEGTPLWAWTGGDGRPVRACAAIGLENSPDETVRRVGRAVEAGMRAVKIKIAPGRDLEHLRAVRGAFPDLSAAADANGAYERGDPFFAAADRLDLAYLEQPLAAGDMDGHAALSGRLLTPVCLDESASTPAGAAEAIERRAGGIVSLKPGLLGVTGVKQMIAKAEANGMAVKIGGLVETSVGRAHALALAARPSARFTDLTPPRLMLTADASRHPWELADGFLAPPEGPGLGIDIDPADAETAGCVTRRLLLTA